MMNERLKWDETVLEWGEMVSKSIRWNQSGFRSHSRGESVGRAVRQSRIKSWYQSFCYFQNTFSIVLTRWTIIRITRCVIYIMYKCHADLFLWTWTWSWWRNFDSLLFNAEIKFYLPLLANFWEIFETVLLENSSIKESWVPFKVF